MCGNSLVYYSALKAFSLGVNIKCFFFSYQLHFVVLSSFSRKSTTFICFSSDILVILLAHFAYFSLYSPHVLDRLVRDVVLSVD